MIVVLHFHLNLSFPYMSKFGNGRKLHGEKTVTANRDSDVDKCQSNLHVMLKQLLLFYNFFYNFRRHFLMN